jgi:hypothetical protein
MTERKYREDEVREIFQLATRQPVRDAATKPTVDGLTIAEMQNIGIEVGLDPDQVSRAVAAYEARPAKPARKSLGMPVEVGHVVSLPRPMTDLEWEQLVTELRTTFHAKGKISVHGNLREWSNGNLHATVEPAADGYRLRMGTFKGDASGINALGITTLAAGGIVTASLAATGELAGAFIVPIIFGSTGIGVLITNFLRLPTWAQRREREMKAIGSKVRALMNAEKP